MARGWVSREVKEKVKVAAKNNNFTQTNIDVLGHNFD